MLRVQNKTLECCSIACFLMTLVLSGCGAVVQVGTSMVSSVFETRVQGLSANYVEVSGYHSSNGANLSSKESALLRLLVVSERISTHMNHKHVGTISTFSFVDQTDSNVLQFRWDRRSDSLYCGEVRTDRNLKNIVVVLFDSDYRATLHWGHITEAHLSAEMTTDVIRDIFREVFPAIEDFSISSIQHE